MSGGSMAGGGASSSGAGGGGSRSPAKGAEDPPTSVVIDYGRRRSSCGYCASSSPTSISHGLWANSLTAEDYQDLLDRGWRRSGCFLYKPEMENTCCPCYTIRLKASDFIASKEQARVLKKMQRFLDGELDWNGKNLVKQINDKKDSGIKANDTSLVQMGRAVYTSDGMGTLKDEMICYLSDRIDCAVSAYLRPTMPQTNIQLPKAVVKKVNAQMKKKLRDLSMDILYTCNICFLIAACLKHRAPEEALHTSDCTPNSIAENLARVLERGGLISDIIVKASNGHLNFYTLMKQEITDQVSAEARTSAECDVGCSKESSTSHCKRLLPKRRLEIRMKKSYFDPVAFALYKRYQTVIHNDKKVSDSSYNRFLVDTPIPYVFPRESDDQVPPCGLGSFHQQYWVDEKLIAVGVVDVLPNCLSSKYLFWDPDLSFLALGKYTALQEISWVKEIQPHCPSLQYYYLGYYIHSCSKMRYKAAYRPSELLCPFHYEWVPYNIAQPLLEKTKYAVLSECLTEQSQSSLDNNCPVELLADRPEEDGGDEEDNNSMDIEVGDDVLLNSEVDVGEDEPKQGIIKNIVVDINGLHIRYEELKPMLRDADVLEKQLHGYVRVVGQELADRMVYSLG